MLGDEIGRGAHGRVYKALNLENGQFVAVKQVSLENIKDEELKNIMVRFYFYIFKYMFPPLLMVRHIVICNRYR